MLQGFRAIRAIKLAILWLILVLGGTFILGFFIQMEISRELGYRRKYGDEWKSVYEQYHGSLAHAHAQLAVAILSLVAVFSISAWMLVRARKKPRSIRHGGMGGSQMFGPWRLIKMIFVGGLFFLCGLFLIGRYVSNEAGTELQLQRQYGSDWRVEYERLHGSLDHAHMRLAIAVGALVAVSGILLWIYLRMRSKGQRRRRGHMR